MARRGDGRSVVSGLGHGGGGPWGLVDHVAHHTRAGGAERGGGTAVSGLIADGHAVLKRREQPALGKAPRGATVEALLGERECPLLGSLHATRRDGAELGRRRRRCKGLLLELPPDLLVAAQHGPPEVLPGLRSWQVVVRNRRRELDQREMATKGRRAGALWAARSAAQLWADKAHAVVLEIVFDRRERPLVARRDVLAVVARPRRRWRRR